jgi:GNAT superfamily N-acetyltransferase
MDSRMMDDDDVNLEREDVLVRNLAADDLRRTVRIDAKITGRERPQMIESRMNRALGNTDINVSLGAEIDGALVGVVMAEVHYGDYGRAEPLAVLDTILVDPDFGGKGVGKALIAQLLKNLRALGVDNLRTEVGWNEQPLVGFLARMGFRPAQRMVLDVAVDDAERRLSHRS